MPNKFKTKPSNIAPDRFNCIYCGKRKSISKLLTISRGKGGQKPIYICNWDCVDEFGLKFRNVREKRNEELKLNHDTK